MEELDQLELKNPFALPSDEEVFRMRDEERRRKLRVKEQTQELKVWEKTTTCATMGQTKRFKDHEMMKRSHDSKQGKYTRGLVAAATAAISNDRRREKENMADFITKKREMFLVQMSLDTKREEIRKLEEKAQMKEEALKKSELMLEEDAIRFDTFLKENDKKAHEAIRRAEKATKSKKDKEQEIKKISQQIQTVQSDISKLKEQVEDCVKYKMFLDLLTPPEFFEEQKNIKAARAKKRLEQRKEARLAVWEEKCKEKVAEAEAHERAEKERLEREGRVMKKGQATAKSKVKLPPRPNLDDEVLTDSGEEIPMYFVKPKQLLDIFTSLEESNLFLIQNSQETEQALEDLRQNFRDTKRKMDRRTAALTQNIDALRGQINVEETKATTLKGRDKSGKGSAEQSEFLDEMHKSVKEVYEKCGFDGDSGTLLMLTELETRMEFLLIEIENMPEDYVMKEEKEKEKERRERVRQERMALQQKMYEERMRKSMARSMQAPKKRKGRQVMWRSEPLRKAVQAERKTDDGANDDVDAQYFQ
jgi:hypothetical protein